MSLNVEAPRSCTNCQVVVCVNIGPPGRESARMMINLVDEKRQRVEAPIQSCPLINVDLQGLPERGQYLENITQSALSLVQRGEDVRSDGPSISIAATQEAPLTASTPPTPNGRLMP